MPKRSSPIVAYLDDDQVWLDEFESRYSGSFDIRCFRFGKDLLRYLEEAKGEPTARPDAFVIDWWLRENGEIIAASEIIGSIKEIVPDTPIVVLTLGDDEVLIGNIDRLGAVYLDKEHLQEKDLLFRTLGLDLDETRERGAKRSDDQSQLEFLATQHHRTKEMKRTLRKRTDDLVSLIKDIVNPEFTINDLCASMLKEILEREPHSEAVTFINLRNFSGILLSRDGASFRDESITLHDLGHARRILNRIMNWKADAPLCLNNLNELPEFRGMRRVNSEHAKHALILPVRRGASSEEREGLIGAFILFGHKSPFELREPCEGAFSDLPLASMFQAAQSMPFRYFDEPPMQNRFARWLHFNMSTWRTYILKHMLEMLRFGILLVAVAFVVWPLAIFIRDYSEPSMPEAVLGVVEKLVMVFTLLVMSLGLLVLLEPRNAGGLPAWIRRFAHISALKSTVLTLVVILLAIFCLTEFIEISREELEWRRNARTSLSSLKVEAGKDSPAPVRSDAPSSPLSGSEASPLKDANAPVQKSGNEAAEKALAEAQPTPSAEAMPPKEDPTAETQEGQGSHRVSLQEIDGSAGTQGDRFLVSTGQYLLFSAISVALLIVAIGLFIRWTLREH